MSHQEFLRAVARARKQGARDGARAAESQGRPVGKVAGSWVTDIAELKQCIVLCQACDAKWKGSESRYGYEARRDWHTLYGGVIGKCDGCREGGAQRKCYAHGSLIGKI